MKAFFIPSGLPLVDTGATTFNNNFEVVRSKTGDIYYAGNIVDRIYKCCKKPEIDLWRADSGYPVDWWDAWKTGVIVPTQIIIRLMKKIPMMQNKFFT